MRSIAFANPQSATHKNLIYPHIATYIYMYKIYIYIYAYPSKYIYIYEKKCIYIYKEHGIRITIEITCGSGLDF